MLWCGCTAGHAAPPLTEAQWHQLRTATDGDDRFDAPALYALLPGLIRWDPGDERGAAVPDWNAIQADPSAHRGAVLLLEGEVRRTRSLRLQRAGDWGPELIEWAVASQDDPEKIVLVYLLPSAAAQAGPTPSRGTPVRLAGWFYRLYQDPKTGQGPTGAGAGNDALAYPMLLAGTATIVSTNPSNASRSSLLIAAVVVLAVGVVALRWFRGRHDGYLGRPGERRRRERSGLNLAPHPGQTPAEVELPDDPAEALQAMSQDHS